MPDMGSMEMPLPDDTLPMMTDTRAPSDRWRWVACKYTGEVQPPTRSPAPKADSKTINVRKPTGGHSNH